MLRCHNLYLIKPDFTNSCQNTLTQENNLAGSGLHLKAFSINSFKTKKSKMIIMEMECYLTSDGICSRNICAPRLFMEFVISLAGRKNTRN